MFWGASALTLGGIAAVAFLPAGTWSSVGLASLGLVSVVCGAIFLKCRTESFRSAMRQTLGAFLIVYGACAICGGLAGHYTPTTPLRSFKPLELTHESLWKLASSEGDARDMIAAAVAAGQKSLILWTAPGCTACSSVLDLTVLNPSVNPKLAGYRLIHVETLAAATHSLREQFGVNNTPALTLMLGDETVPTYGRIEIGIDAPAVMDLLDTQEQAEDAAR